MPSFELVKSIDTPQSFRVQSVAGLFDIPLADKVRHVWQVDLPIETRDWHIGLIVGPSGCGKSSIAQALWPDQYRRGYTWDERSVLDNFPAGMEVKRIVSTLTSVGFSSPPDWVKPYHVLSTGQQMRCDLARSLCEDGLIVFDEFTSVVDRTVAQIGSAALAKAVRAVPGRQFVAVTCHEDVLDWLTPDWTYAPQTNTFQWRCLQRPPIELTVCRCDATAWPLFRQHHYLSAELNPGAACYLVEWRNIPVAFCAVLSVIGFANTYRISRAVVLPDYQGVGIGSAMLRAIAQHYIARGKRLRITTSHPGYINHCRHDAAWKLAVIKPTGTTKHGGKTQGKRDGTPAAVSHHRPIVTYEYVGQSA